MYGAVVFVPGDYLEPGEVINARVGHYGYLEVGRYPVGTDGLCARVVEDLAAAGFAAAVNPTVMRAKGAKCLGNLANAVAAITGSQRGAETFMARARDEARRVWRAAGVDFEESEEFDVRRKGRYRGSDRWPGDHGTPRRGGSSWQSLMRGAGSIESEFLNGEVVQLGRLLGISAPCNEVLWRPGRRDGPRRRPAGTLFHSRTHPSSQSRTHLKKVRPFHAERPHDRKEGDGPVSYCSAAAASIASWKVSTYSWIPRAPRPAT